MNLESQPSMGAAAKEQTLGHFLSNINSRGVRNGAFQLHFDGKKQEQVTLNVNHAETISAPATHFADNQYSEILDNVASNDVFFQLPEKLRSYLKWPTSQISEIDLETQIWMLHWEMHELERMEEDPRKYANRLKPGAVDQLCAVFPFLWVLHFLGWAGIIISIIMLWRFGCPHLYWAKIFLTVCKFYLNNKMINSIKAALGFPLAIFLQTSV